MENLDLDRLGTDIDYWNEVAPEDATHYDIGGSMGDDPSFMKEGYPQEHYHYTRWLYWDDDSLCWDSYGALEGSDVVIEMEKRLIPKPSARKRVSYQENPYEESKTVFEEVANLCKQTNITLIFNESLSELGAYTIIDNDFDRSLMTYNIKTVLTVLKKKKAFVDEMNNWECVE